MAALTVNGECYEVLGGVDWSPAGMRRTPLAGGGPGETPAFGYITARIRIGAHQSSTFDPPSEVQLELGDGRTVTGSDMFDTDSGRVHGDVRTVMFQGQHVDVF